VTGDELREMFRQRDEAHPEIAAEVAQVRADMPWLFGNPAHEVAEFDRALREGLRLAGDTPV
jgi:hypothetical protein